MVSPARTWGDFEDPAVRYTTGIPIRLLPGRMSACESRRMSGNLLATTDVTSRIRREVSVDTGLKRTSVTSPIFCPASQIGVPLRIPVASAATT